MQARSIEPRGFGDFVACERLVAARNDVERVRSALENLNVFAGRFDGYVMMTKLTLTVRKAVCDDFRNVADRERRIGFGLRGGTCEHRHAVRTGRDGGCSRSVPQLF